MTNDDLQHIKEHIEIHARREPQAIKITNLLWQAVAELEKEEWHYPAKGELPTEKPINTLLLGLVKCPKRYMVVCWNGKWFYDASTYNDEVKLICWRYIEPPKEKE